MKNDFCDMTQDEIQGLNVPNRMKGLLLSGFQHNRDGRGYVMVPEDTFKEFTDCTAGYLKMLSDRNSVTPPQTEGREG
jgi:hypothetical protein